ncbi:tRNAHis-5'-guanylyltransferase [Yersinia phage fHe-Yen9-04]|uniref:tRNAHis-5'-guanylyltransferase n=1 Tax=Yersinia phage fHe-Yen9-04 TaxID=2052742 RepID=A0A2C9CWZ0_9CAUD|nr:tRNA-His guanylyltransferase [Yersinia phage fHe-Yen9-04]SOK58419.1 tRNAHis-5'-guanylyltransferase [Yersinia phage fHe-Yen9-04]VUE36188.1 tRNAHis-5'-guanylyltransferase [Yersinia phage fHe-Yen9-04]
MKLGDRIKLYEKMETSNKFMPGLPIYARIDGRSFSKFTNKMIKPYDQNLSRLMQEVTKYLVKETSACIGYTQSDEISLVFMQKSPESDIFFSGKKQKMVSVLAALATAKFIELALKFYPEECSNRLPVFDCRVFQVPNKSEAANCLIWRSQDAIRNSIQMAGRAVFSHKELDRKNQNDILDMLINEKGINWNDYPKFFKEGSFFQRVTYEKDGQNGEVVIRSKVDEIIPELKFENLSTEEKVKLIFGVDND